MYSSTARRMTSMYLPWRRLDWGMGIATDIPRVMLILLVLQHTLCASSTAPERPHAVARLSAIPDAAKRLFPLSPDDYYRHHRSLEDNLDFEYNKLSQFSIRFVKCQYVKMFDDDLADDEDSDTVLAMQHFVVYKLCPTDDCNPDQDCGSDVVHGEYAIDVADYLQTTVEFQQAEFEYMCDNCNERCNEDGDYCSGCGKICYQLANLEAAGYVDASQYIECQQIEIANDDDDGEQGDGEGDENNNDDQAENALYVGPKCSSDGSSIKIGLFTDEDCVETYEGYETVEDLLGVKLSYHVLANTFSNDGSVCLTCKENQDNENADDAADGDDVNEMCENLYAVSAKCESPFGLEGGFVDQNLEDGDYENQVENEFMVCNFIQSLIWNSYTEKGEIDIDSPQDEIIRQATPVQITIISLLATSILGLIGYAYYLYQKIEKVLNTPKLALASQTDHQIT